MITINGQRFYGIPGSCGSCSFFSNGSTDRQPGGELGHCIMFNEWHKRWCTTPRRCMKLFKKAFTFADGSELIITAGSD
jgi:hypothetical protein